MSDTIICKTVLRKPAPLLPSACLGPQDRGDCRKTPCCDGDCTHVLGSDWVCMPPEL